jgi:hypothetical protein
MTSILPHLKKAKFQLHEFNKESPVLEIEANDPDDACYIAYKKLYDLLSEQVQKKDREALQDFKHDFRIINAIKS